MHQGRLILNRRPRHHNPPRPPRKHLPARQVQRRSGALDSLIVSSSRNIAKVDELLTLTGLRLLYERNQSHRK